MEAMNAAPPKEILLVEDSPGDVRLAAEALKDGKVRNRLHVAGDGLEASEFLGRKGRFAGAPRPDLILLDLNLPKKDGRELLAEIKSDERLCTIPVVVLTTSRAEEDVIRTYRLHANCYVTKPLELDAFLEVVRAVTDFWLTTVELPSGALDG